MASKSKCSWCLNYHVAPWGNFCRALLDTQRHTQAISRNRALDNNTVILPMSLLAHQIQTLHQENKRPEQVNSGSQPSKSEQMGKEVPSELQSAQMSDIATSIVQESQRDMALLEEFDNPKTSSTNIHLEYELKINSPEALAFWRKLEAMEVFSNMENPEDKVGSEGVPALALMGKLRAVKMKDENSVDGFKVLRSASLPMMELHKPIEIQIQQQRLARQIERRESEEVVQEDSDVRPHTITKYEKPREPERALQSNNLSVCSGGIDNDAFELEELDPYEYDNEVGSPDPRSPHGGILKGKPHCKFCKTYFDSVRLNDDDDDAPERPDIQEPSTNKTICPNCQIFISPVELEDNYVFDSQASASSRHLSRAINGALISTRAMSEDTWEANKASTHPTPSPNLSPSTARKKAPRRYSMGSAALEQYMSGEVYMHHGELLFATREALTDDQDLFVHDTLELGYPGPADKGLLKRQSNGGTHLDDVDVLTHKPPGMMDAGVPATRRDQPVRVELSVVYLKIGEIDTLKEHYEADVLIKAKWREPLLDRSKELPASVDWASYWNPKLFIENTIGEPRETAFHMYVHNAKGEAFIIEKRRVKGVFLENLELKDFPFDVQDLTVTIMSERSCLEIEIAEDPDDMHKVNKQSFIDEQEWHLYKCVETEIKEVTNEYSDPSIKRSALSVKCRAARRPAYFFWNIFLITFLICSLAFATFSVKRELPQNRLQLSFTLVLTSVAFKFVVNQSLPKISYLTYLDKYVLVAMILLTTVCAWHGLTSAINLEEKDGKLLELVALIVFMGGYFLFNLIFVIRIYMRPGRKRRIMKFKEREYMERMDIQMTKQKAMTLKQVADSPYITVI